MIPRCDLTQPRAPRTRRHAVLDDLAGSQRALVEEALAAPLGCIDNALFAQPEAERQLFDPGVAVPPVSTSWYHPSLTDHRSCRPPNRSDLLTPAQEQFFFLRYNYARRRAKRAVAQYRAHPSTPCAREIALWYGRATDARTLITNANLALVLSLARRYRIPSVDPGELISEGNMALLRAVDAFDVSRGFKFSSYACRAILGSFHHVARNARRYRAAFPIEFDALIERSDDVQTRRAVRERDALDELHAILRANRAGLSDIERTVIGARFGIDRGPDAPAMTLVEVSHIVGVTKERVRQIQNKVLTKLRAIIKGKSCAMSQP